MLEIRYSKSSELALLLGIHFESGWMGWSSCEIWDERIENGNYRTGPSVFLKNDRGQRVLNMVLDHEGS